MNEETEDNFDIDETADLFEDDSGVFDLSETELSSLEDLESIASSGGDRYDASVVSSLSAFQRAANRYPPLNAEQQLVMISMVRQAQEAEQKLANGNYTAREEKKLHQMVNAKAQAVEHLCASCWRLTWLIVREQADERFGRDKATALMPDLIAEANTALVAAVYDFDAERTPRFGTYAARVIRDHTRAVLGREGYLRLAPSWNRVKRIAATRIPELVSELGRNPTTEELQKDLLNRCMDWAYSRLSDEQKKLPEMQQKEIALAKLRKQGMLGAIRDIEEVLTISQSVASLDQPLGDEGGATLGETIREDGSSGEFDNSEMEELRQALQVALSGLTEREQKIVLLRYGFDGSDGWTYAKISEQFDISSERVRQIERAALAKLKTPGATFNALSSFISAEG